MKIPEKGKGLKNCYEEDAATFVRECYDYDKTSGVLSWKLERPDYHFVDDRHRNSYKARHSGKVVGGINSKGYLSLAINGVCYLLHRVVYLYVEGHWPKEQIDHINGVRTDNRWCNLRDADYTLNSHNQKIRSDNTTGITGVCFDKTNKVYHAVVCKTTKGVFKKWVIKRSKSLEECRLAREDWITSDGTYSETHGKR